MAFQDVAFLPCRASHYTTVLNVSDVRGEDLVSTTFLQTVDGGKQGHASCKILLLQQCLLLCRGNLAEIVIQQLTKMM